MSVERPPEHVLAALGAVWSAAWSPLGFSCGGWLARAARLLSRWCPSTPRCGVVGEGAGVAVHRRRAARARPVRSTDGPRYVVAGWRARDTFVAGTPEPRHDRGGIGGSAIPRGHGEVGAAALPHPAPGRTVERMSTVFMARGVRAAWEDRLLHCSLPPRCQGLHPALLTATRCAGADQSLAGHAQADQQCASQLAAR